MKNEVLYYLSSMKGNILDTVSSAIINNAKGQISKWVLQENKPRQIFQKKKKYFLSPDTHTCVYE